jgi:hypothetical protein
MDPASMGNGPCEQLQGAIVVCAKFSVGNFRQSATATPQNFFKLNFCVLPGMLLKTKGRNFDSETYPECA